MKNEKIKRPLARILATVLLFTCVTVSFTGCVMIPIKVPSSSTSATTARNTPLSPPPLKFVPPLTAGNFEDYFVITTETTWVKAGSSFQSVIVDYTVRPKKQFASFDQLPESIDVKLEVGLYDSYGSEYSPKWSSEMTVTLSAEGKYKTSGEKKLPLSINPYGTLYWYVGVVSVSETPENGSADAT